jgi:hypothetical protein
VNAQKEVQYSDRILGHNTTVESPEDLMLLKESIEDALAQQKKLSERISPRKKERKKMRKSGQNRTNGYIKRN